ncbi:MAG: hypothetical protein ACE14V_14695 [bacterium]
MLFPMMGLLFFIAFFGFISSFILLLIPRLRFLAAYALCIPSCGTILAFCLFWGMGLTAEKIGIEKLFLVNIAILAGYPLGLLLGGMFGFFIARFVNYLFRSP